MNFPDIKIVIARHGQTDFNVVKKIQDPINPRLTLVGHAQAKALKKEIHKLGLSFDLIVCSNASRNIETLKHVYQNYQTLPNVKIDRRLQERYHKDLIGKTAKEIENMLGYELNGRLSWHLYFEGTDKSQLSDHFIHNETLASVKKRLFSLMNEFRNKKTVFLLGSSIINQYILEYLHFGTIGEQKIVNDSNETIDFQKNNELRIMTFNSSKQSIKYLSVFY